MVVTVELESDEARRAADAADEDQVLLVPRTKGGYASVGTVARIEQRGDGPNDTPVVVLRGVGRARVGQGSVGEDGALLVAADPVVDPGTDRRGAGARRPLQGDGHRPVHPSGWPAAPEVRCPG